MNCKLTTCTTALLLAASRAIAQPSPSGLEWPTLSGDGARTASRDVAVPTFGTPRWVLSQTSAGQAIRFIGPASVAATAHPTPRVFTVGVIAGTTFAIAASAETGTIAWATPIPDLVYDSWSSPTLDHASGTVLYATGISLIALRVADGTQAWRTDLLGPPVNVTPLVTRDLSPRNRAFVTDYGGFGGPSTLTCINISPRHPIHNPFDPGDVVWSAPIGSSTGGTPTLLDGTVYVCSTGLEGAGFGEIRAFDARWPGPTPPEPRWIFSNPIMEGFFGGLTARHGDGGPFLYAATYAFYGGVDTANLVKVHAATGDLVWSVASNRTDSVPIVLADGRIVLSTGLPGFGSVPMVQMFEDRGTSAIELWNTADETWTDLNQNGIMDLGEFLLVGGWTMHPVLADLPSRGPRLLVGAIPTGGEFGAYTRLYELDLRRTPADAGFVVQQTTSAGSSPAMLGAGFYSVSTAGLAAIGPPPPRPDVNGDGLVDTEDLYAWEQRQGFRDIDRSGVIDLADRDMLVRELRRNELRDLEGR